MGVVVSELLGDTSVKGAPKEGPGAARPGVGGPATQSTRKTQH
jgi:hypothetical protein